MLSYEGIFHGVVWHQLQFSSSVGIELIPLLYRSSFVKDHKFKCITLKTLSIVNECRLLILFNFQ